MATCRLCELNEANQTGSHSVPYSLIKSAVNYNGDSKRGKEFITKVGSRIDYPVYVGRDIIPEKEEEARTKYRYENAGRRHDNPYVEDYILCTSCEKKLSIIEGLFAERVMHLSDNYDHQKVTELILKYEDGLLTRLYAISLFLRLSIFKSPWDFKLVPSEQRTLRILVNKCLADSKTGTMENLLSLAPSLCAYPILVIHNHQLEDQSTAAIVMAVTKMPYTFIANRFIFLLYIKKSHLKAVRTHLFGITDLTVRYKYSNSLDNIFSMLLLDLESTNLINQSVYSTLAQNHLHLVNSKLNHSYKKKWSELPHKDVLEAVVGMLYREGYYTGSVAPGIIEKVIDDVVEKSSPGFVKWLNSRPPGFIEGLQTEQ